MGETTAEPEVAARAVEDMTKMDVDPAKGERLYKAALIHSNKGATYRMLSKSLQDGRLDLVLASYNAGESAVECYRSGRTIRTSSGKVINPRILRGGTDEINDRILDIFEAMPRWTPAIRQDVNVPIKLKQTIIVDLGSK